MKFHIIAGHNLTTDPGATSTHLIKGFIKEADLTVEFRDLLCLELANLNIPFNKDNDSHTLTQVIANLTNSVSKNDLMIDIHFNAATPQATGTEVILKNNHNNFEFITASKFSAEMADTLKIRDRGVKTESQTPRRRIGILHVPCNTILLEICFITNTNDVNKYVKWRKVLASRLADIINRIYLNSLK